MTDQQEYDIFILKFGDKVRELREDYSNLSDVNKRRFEKMCQTVFTANGVAFASGMVNNFLQSKYLG
ncbi:MAG: hypothetical protein UEP57_08445 [Oscillospiraceae bacterium]|nr:hypothetical protein [Oscillospiraceae bacterium]